MDSSRVKRDGLRNCRLGTGCHKDHIRPTCPDADPFPAERGQYITALASGCNLPTHLRAKWKYSGLPKNDIANPDFSPHVLEGRGFKGCGKTSQTVILSSSEGSCPERFQGNARFFVACWLLRMTILRSFFAADRSPPFVKRQVRFPAGRKESFARVVNCPKTVVRAGKSSEGSWISEWSAGAVREPPFVLEQNHNNHLCPAPGE
jgi:hypothetical protein